jgi:diguanylate cyclase (GGDEF)-like protein/PAS domain S-box-containing protein
MLPLPSDLEKAPASSIDYVAQLQARIAVLEQVIASQSAELAHAHKIFETASVAAKIGVWECTLPDATLRWSDGVYDLFGLPRGSKITRETILEYYPTDSRAKLNGIRSKAIENGSGFATEVEIIKATGERRWIRLTATVETENGDAVRIFGIKQDITEERNLLDQTRYLAEFDVLTGLANRSQFQRRLSRLDPRDSGYRPVSALLLVDIDKFKDINDTFGHILGDRCLTETANHINAVCPEAELVARIGGDEFAVLLRPGLTRSEVTTIAGLIVQSVAGINETSRRIPSPSVSVGVAKFVGQTASDLFIQADSALYAAKNSGRNRFHIFEADATGADASKSAA